MSRKLHFNKSIMSTLLIVFFSICQSIAQTTLAEWTIDTGYDVAGTDPKTYTPNALGFAEVSPIVSTDVIYPKNFVGTQTDYEMSIHPGSSSLLTDNSYVVSARMNGAVSPADFTDVSNHANYFQFSFPTTGYDQITLDFDMTTHVPDDYFDVVYSSDGGTSWTIAAQNLNHTQWWTTTSKSVDIVAKNKSNVLVRMIGVDGGGAYDTFYVASFKVYGNSTTIPTDTASTISWSYDLGTDDQSATYTDDTYYKLDNVTKGSNYVYNGTRSGTNPVVTYTSFKNETGGNTPAGNDANNLIGFEFTPVTGLDFAPTNISFDCQRYGTGSGLIDVYWKSSDGTSTQIATGIKPARDGDATSEASDTNTFTMDVSGLSIPALGGKSTLEIYIHSLGNAKEVALANISVEGVLNGTIADLAQYTITTSVSPLESGTVVSDNPSTVDEGTTINLTAKANFGYEFVEWQDDLGATVSTDNPFAVTINENSSYKAVFNQLTTYSLDLNVEGGANDYMIAISPEGTMVEGARMYEAGTTVTLTASGNQVFNFSNWNTGETNSELVVSMNENKNITASYNAADYIVGWDFHDDIVTVDFSSNVVNDAINLDLRNAAGDTTNGLNFSAAANQKWYGKNCRINWTQLGDKYYYQVKINASDFTDLSVQASLLTSYSGYATQKCEYSLDGTNFTEVGTYDTSTLNSWVDETFNLPADANNKAEVYIRWIPDYTSSSIGNGNDGTSISDIYIYGTPAIFNDGVAPVLSSSVPSDNAVGASATGKIVLNFDERIKISETAVATLNGENLTPVVFGKSISFNYSGLDYNTNYTFDLSGNLVADLADNTLTDPISISFTTIDKPMVSKRAYDFVVGVDGDFAAALTAADAAKNSGNRFYIFFPNGEYDLGNTTGDATQQTFIGLPNVSFIGQSTEGVVLYNNPTQADEGINTTPTINFTSTANNIYMQDLTVLNKMDYRLGIPEKRAVALRHQGDKNIFKNVRLLSNQDTYFTGDGRTYWENGEIHGTVDYIFGGGDIFFNECTMYMENRSSGGGGIVTAAATSSDWGYVFSNCTIDGDAQQNGIYSLGRPWNNEPKVVYINTTMEITPSSGAWGDPMNVVPFKFAEYNSLTSSGIQVDLSQRRTDYTKDAISVTLDPTLSQSEAANYTIDNVLGGVDTWQPTLHTEQAKAPVLSSQGAILTWNDSNYVLGWAVFKDDIFQSFVTTNSYDITGVTSGVFSVRAANGMGGLSPKSNEIDASSLGVKENVLELNNIKINYNSNGNIDLQLGGELEKTVLSLYNLTGQKVFSINETSGENKNVSVDISNYAKGIYLLRVNKGGAYKSFKIIKQ